MAAAASERQDTTPASLAQSGLALYRKYRPATFAEVKGQEHVTGPLRQALRTGRINHAYLFSGPRGCGKTSSARILARSLNCVNGPTPDPCGSVRFLCRARAVRAGQHRRDRDRRGLARRRGRRQGTTRAGLLHAGVRALQDLHHRRGAHGHPAGLQCAAEAGRRAAAAPEVHFRHHRTGEGHPDHPVPYAPLSVPPGASVRAAGADAGHPGCRRRHRRKTPCCRWWCGRGRARSGTRSPSWTSCWPAATSPGSRTSARWPCSVLPTPACSTRSWTRSPRPTARRCSAS